MDVDVVSEVAVAGRCPVGASPLKDSESRRLAMNVSIIGSTVLSLESQYPGEKGERLFDIFDMHEGRDLNEVGHCLSAAQNSDSCRLPTFLSSERLREFPEGSSQTTPAAATRWAHYHCSTRNR